MVTPSFYPKLGGVEKHVLRVSQMLLEKGINVDILSLNGEKSLEKFEKIMNLNITRINRKKKLKLSILAWMLKNLKYLSNIDLVHCHDYNTFLLFGLPFKIIFPWKKVYITFHGWEGIYPIPKRILFYRKITELLTNGNICVGHYIEKWYNTKATAVIYGAADIIESKHCEKRENNIIRFAYVGRLEKDTGIIEYLNTLKLLNERYNLDFHIKIIGDGSLRKYSEDFCKANGIKSNFYGFVENPEELILDCDYLFVSGYLSMIEGLKLGKIPIAIYNNPVKRDYFKMIPNFDKILVVSSSSEELYEEICKLISDESARREKIISAIEWVKDKSWEKVAEVYINIWRVNYGSK